MEEQAKKPSDRVEDLLLLIGALVAASATAMGVMRVGVISIWVLLAGTAIFVAGCCRHMTTRGRSWALGLLSLLPMIWARASGGARPSDAAGFLGYEMGKTLIGLALGFGLVCLFTMGRKKRG
jgi:hypothetical protein